MRTKEPSPIDRTTATLPLPSSGILDFALPANLEASEPPEARGLARDEVRLMVTREDALTRETSIEHAQFRDLPDFLQPGDLVVINTSATRNAAVSALRTDGVPVVVHLSSRIPGDRWVVEIRKPEGNATAPFRTADIGDIYRLPRGVTVTLIAPYRAPEHGPVRLWEANIEFQNSSDIGEHGESADRLDTYLSTYGRPIRYKYVDRDWPSKYYQTVYADEMGSAEMPSAGRGFTEDILRRLEEKGVGVARLILHTGVASLETREPPYDEYYRVPAETADAVNTTRRNGGRVIAVGTTVVRALETVTDIDGVAHAGEGWTDLVITPERGVRAVDGLITGLHEPEATHLLMLLSMASPTHLRRAYRAALDNGYLWHEFGDLHLLLR
jgi:S-adenosylmethionine:tRNA ribosyltransferase-isomerase